MNLFIVNKKKCRQLSQMGAAEGKGAAGGALNGLLSTVGAGSFYDPLGEASAKLQAAQDEQRSTIDALTLEVNRIQTEVDDKLYSFIETSLKEADAQNQVTVQLLDGRINKNSLTTQLILFQVILLYIFILEKRPCCNYIKQV